MSGAGAFLIPEFAADNVPALSQFNHHLIVKKLKPASPQV
jgi:hypothetical protein